MEASGEANAEQLRYARGSNQAREQARAFIGKVLINRQTGVNAVVSGQSLKKMLSKSAVIKSTGQQAHHQAVANADRLFARASLRLTRQPNRPSDIGKIKHLHHFDSAMLFDGRVLRVKLLVKEWLDKRRSNTLYTLASVEVEKPSAIV